MPARLRLAKLLGRGLVLAAAPTGFFILAATSTMADDLALLSEGKVVETVLSDGLPNETGRWQTKTQLVFDPKSQRVERRTYEYFDPAPSRHLDVIWYPEDVNADRPGRITGAGRMVWRHRDRPAWDPAGVVDVFAGEMSRGQPGGSGEFITSDGLTYEGTWRNGRPAGIGRLRLPSGEEYSGSFKNGMADGEGREFDQIGEVFEGTFHAGLRNGEGKTKLPSGFSYDSHWVNGVESPWSRRVRLAQVGGPSGPGGGQDVRMSVTVLPRPNLPQGVRLSDVVAYGSSNNGSTITVQPADAKLMAAWKGSGPVQTGSGGSAVRSGIFRVDNRYIDAVPPTFVLEFQNHSAQTIQVSSLRLDVTASDTDNQPAIQMVDLADAECGGVSYSTDYDLENYGWSTAYGAQLRVSFTSPREPANGQVTKSVGDLTLRQRINLDPELQRFRVDTARLKRASDQGFPCPSGSMQACLASLRSSPLFGTLGSKLSLNGAEITIPASGFLDYRWRDSKGQDHTHSSSFSVIVGLGHLVELAECGEGAAPEPILAKSLQLRLDATSYTLPVQFQRTIAAGQMARFALPVAAAKSSDHAFRIVATLADGREVSSLPIQLVYFRPRELPDPPDK